MARPWLFSTARIASPNLVLATTKLISAIASEQTEIMVRVFSDILSLHNSTWPSTRITRIVGPDQTMLTTPIIMPQIAIVSTAPTKYQKGRPQSTRAMLARVVVTSDATRDTMKDTVTDRARWSEVQEKNGHGEKRLG